MATVIEVIFTADGEVTHAEEPAEPQAAEPAESEESE